MSAGSPPDSDPDPYRIDTHAQLDALFEPPRAAQVTKQLDRLDAHCRRWIERSPFIVVGSVGADGRLDLSPKGDPPGFVTVLDDRTLVIPDRPGNRRFDTFRNVIDNPRVALAFFVPGREEIVRVGGSATITRRPDLLETLAERGRAPRMALVVTVDEAMFHCGKSMIRSGLWAPERWPDIDGLATYAQCLADQAEPDETLEDMEIRFASWAGGNELY